MPTRDERQPSWWLDPPDDPEPEVDPDLEEQRLVDRYLDSLE